MSNENENALENRHFLVVDDEEFMARTITRMLKACGAASVNYAADGAKAMQSMPKEATLPDCIISDFNMGRLNGLQLLLGVRMGLSPHIPRHQPIIMVTGHGDHDVVRTALSLDVNGYVVKPVAQTKLIEVILRALATPISPKAPEHYRAIQLPKP